jgi:hypothetical protein
MNDEEIFQRWVQAHARADTDSMAQYMDDDFLFEQAGMEKRFDKDEYLDLVDAMGRAFPDLDIDASEVDHDADANEIRWRKELSATHEQDLDLTELGLPFFFPTGENVEVDADEARTRIEDGKIARHALDGDETGLASLLSQVESGLEGLREEARSHETQR